MNNFKTFTEADFDVSPSHVQIGPELGRGNFSKVFKGSFKGQVVAVKQQDLADADLERYLLNELAILRYMKHEGCIKFFGAFRGDGIISILTEYLEGGDLRRLLKDKTTPLGWKYRGKVALGCARALAYIHSLEIIHRDIKTENVLLSPDGSPKLCDFGFARIWDKTKTMTMCGTEEFMAPEILFSIQYDEKVDVYSFGIMLAEMLTRKAPGKREAFLDRVPQDGFNVNFDELDKETSGFNPPASLVLLTKECLAPEAPNRLSAPDIVGWLEEFMTEIPDDKEPAPVLSADVIKDKLEQYLKAEAEEEEEEKDDEGKTGGSSKPRTIEEKHRVEAALTERDIALQKSHHNVDNNNEAPKKSTSSGSGGIFSCFFPGNGSSRSSVTSTRALEMAGWVTKRGGRIKTWKRRYMVITSIGIVYFKSPEDQHNGGEAQGSIEFADMTAVAGVVANAVPTVMTGKPNSFGVHTANRTYYIAAASPDERGRWIRAISDGHRAYLDKKKGKSKKTLNTRDRGNSNVSQVRIELK